MRTWVSRMAVLCLVRLNASAALITIEGSGDSDRMWDATSGERSYADAPLLWQHQAWRENEPMAVLFA
ncbi:MAG: hypothetical protein P8080_11735, partial [Gammaproteobacteria bacterium]